MLAVKAKHATMLLTVSDVEGLTEEMDSEKSKKSSAQAVMVRDYNVATKCTYKALCYFCQRHTLINKPLESFCCF